MRKIAALFCTALLLALLLIVPVQATLTTEEEEATEIDPFANTEQNELLAAQNALPPAQDDLQYVPPGLTAEDMYTGPVDNFSGVPLGAEEGDIGGEIVLINDTTGYNQSRHMFSTLQSSLEILSNVADGMITTDPVSLIVPEGVVCQLYRDGQPVGGVDPLNICELGSYVLLEAGGNQSEIMRFTIVGGVTGQLARFEVPTGFEITKVRCNDEVIDSGSTYVSLETEGQYIIEYCCPIVETRYQFSTVVDHTPPTLLLEAVDERGYAKGPVDISDIEDGTRVGIWLDDRAIPFSEVLTESGAYRIILEDEAGNTNSYQFMIRYYFNVSGIIFLIAVLLVSVGVGIYVLYSRRHVRVR